jgi:hypothetical protein
MPKTMVNLVDSDEEMKEDGGGQLYPAATDSIIEKSILIAR